MNQLESSVIRLANNYFSNKVIEARFETKMVNLFEGINSQLIKLTETKKTKGKERTLATRRKNYI